MPPSEGVVSSQDRPCQCRVMRLSWACQHCYIKLPWACQRRFIKLAWACQRRFTNLAWACHPRSPKDGFSPLLPLSQPNLSCSSPLVGGTHTTAFEMSNVSWTHPLPTTPTRPRPTRTSRLPTASTSGPSTASCPVKERYLNGQLPDEMNLDFVPHRDIRPVWWGHLLVHVDSGWPEESAYRGVGSNDAFFTCSNQRMVGCHPGGQGCCLGT